jgi:hypothetical protein
MTVEDAAPQFDERAVELIKASLPAGIDQRRLDLLPLVLNEWSRTDLREHVSLEGRATVRTRYDRLKKVGDCATLLRQALEAIDQRGRSWIVQEIAREEGSTFFSVSREKFTDMRERVNQEYDFLRKLTAATMRRLKQEDDFLRKLTTATLRLSEEDEERKRGHPRNIPAYLVMLDLAAIFEWLTDSKATRVVDRTDHTETGPFWRFAESVWSVAFGTTRGLKAAMKNWAEARELYHEHSSFLLNLPLRRPEWGIFGSNRKYSPM